MKVSKITWDQDKASKQLNSCRQFEAFAFRLLCSFFVILIISGCSFWPENSERKVSVSHRVLTLPPGVDREYLKYLLEVSKKRYIELKHSGAQYCLPGQMLRITKKQNLVKHEIDGGLLLDARLHIKDVFAHLYNIKNQIENNNPSAKCYKTYADFNDGAVRKLGVWEDSAEINVLMEGE